MFNPCDMESPGFRRGRNAGKSREVALLWGATGSCRWGLHYWRTGYPYNTPLKLLTNYISN